MIVNRRKEVVPRGCIGEIVLGGIAVADGYVGAAKSRENSFYRAGKRSDGMLYRTGDLGRWREDGELMFHGRVDRQIKVRGFRVEPGEIEAACCRHQQVSAAAVLALRNERGAVELMACVVPRRAGTVTADEVKSQVARLLPMHMVPSRVVVARAIPLNQNGKVNYIQLVSDVGKVGRQSKAE
jgi:acyl-CoA synthetase (AMP-forming)/AMP-acid ligase II